MNIPVQGSSDAAAAASSSATSSPSSPPRSSSDGKKEKKQKEPVDLRTIDPTDLKLDVYNEGKSYAIHGDATRLYVQDLKAMHAVFVPWLPKLGKPGWSISVKRKEEITAWFKKVEAGEVKVDIDAIEKYHSEKAVQRAQRKAATESVIQNVPTISGGASKAGSGFVQQTIIVKAPLPVPGKKATLKVGDSKFNYIVESVTNQKGSVVEAIVHRSDDKNTRSRIVLKQMHGWNFAWKFDGFDQEHSIRFA